MVTFNSNPVAITILARDDRTAAAVAFSCRQINLLKAFVYPLRGNFFKRSCEFFLYLKPFCKKRLLHRVLIYEQVN